MSVLHRKAQVGKQEHQARAMTVPKALRVALAKVADKSFDMALAVIGVAQERWTGDEVERKLPEDVLLLLLDGPAGASGGMLLDRALVSALVQQQTTGRVSKSPASTRPMTATDAALCAPLIDAFFVRAHGLLETQEDRDVLPCLKFGARADSPRLFGLAMERAEYRVLRVTIDIAAGTAQSTMTLLLPVPEVKAEPVFDEGTGTLSAPRVTLAGSVMSLRAELAAVLCRTRLSLSQLGNLSPGDILPIPMEAFDSVELVSIDGRVVGKGTMGQVDGNRALMVCTGEARKTAQGLQDATDYDLIEEPSDYSKLDLPELNIKPGPDLYEPDDDGNLPDLPDLPDLPNLPPLDEDFPDLGDLPKLNIA